MPGYAEQLSIAERRRRIGLTQKHLGELVGFDQPTVSRAENGRLPEAIVGEIISRLAELERKRDTDDRASAEEFWAAVGNVAERASVIGRIVRVAGVLLGGPLSDVHLANQLLDCLPECERANVLSARERE